MRGEFLPVWSETWRDIWAKLAKHPDAPEDLFSELYRAMAQEPLAPQPPPQPTAFDENGRMTEAAEIAADEAYRAARAEYELERTKFETAISADRNAKAAFRKEVWFALDAETKAVSALERTFEILGEFDNGIQDVFFVLVQKFISKYSLRYDLRVPFQLCPTLPGIFSSLIHEMQAAARGSQHLQGLLFEFEESIRTLRGDPSAAQMKTCLHRQFNLLEGIGRACPNVNAATLGEICGQVDTWPHATLKEAAKKLYGFRSDYPGIGHAGNPDAVLRDIEMKDLVAVSVLLAGLVPYLSHQVDSNIVYGGRA